MLESFSVKGFKGIRQGVVDNLGQVNIITGKNNMGKSAFLQSICLFNEKCWKLIDNFKTTQMHWLYDPQREIEIEVQSNSRTFRFLFDDERGILYDIRDLKSTGLEKETEHRIEKGFYFFDSKVGFFLDAKRSSYQLPVDDAQRLSNFIKDENNPVWMLQSSIFFNHCNFLTRSTEFELDFDHLQNILNEEENFLDALSDAYDVKFSALRHSPKVIPGWTLEYNDGNKPRRVSVDSLGDGTRTAMNILLLLYVAKSPKIILIDEIETHQHAKALRHVCKSVLAYIARENAQLFVTTHSMDAIKEMLEITKEKGLETLVHHFILKEGNLETRTTPGLDAKTVVDVEGDIRFADEYA
jgi:AAA15 family ATPase/GTPase